MWEGAYDHDAHTSEWVSRCSPCVGSLVLVSLYWVQVTSYVSYASSWAYAKDLIGLNIVCKIMRDFTKFANKMN